MEKNRRPGKGRSKNSKEPTNSRRESNVSANEPSKANEIRDVKFHDTDCEYQQLTGNNDLQRNSTSNSKNHTRRERAPDDVSSLQKESTNAVIKQEANYNIGIGATNSLSSFHQTSPHTEEQHNSSITTTHRSEISKEGKLDIAKRPNFGGSGRKIAVVSNYFLLKGNGNDIYHYDVEITDPSQSSKKKKSKTIKEEKASGTAQKVIQQKRDISKQKCREVIKQLISKKSLTEFQPYYDGCKNLYTFHPLPIGKGISAEVILSDSNRKKTYIVVVKPVRKNDGANVISLESLNKVCSGRSDEVPLEAIIAFEVILCHQEPPFRQVGIGRSFFSFSEMRKNPIDPHLEVWKGYNRSLQLTQKGPAILVNAASKAIHCSGFVIERACNILGCDITKTSLTEDDINDLTNSLCGLKVEVTHLPYPKRYTVEAVTQCSAKDLTVKIDGKNMSVSQYFAQKYRRLKFPYLPCLSMSTQKEEAPLIPMEVCVIFPGQPKLGKLNPKQTAIMMNMTATRPRDRFDKIMNYAETISRISGTYIKQAGYDMELTPLHLTARVITAPALAYNNGPSVQPDVRGVWRIGKNFTYSTYSSSNARWVLISFAPKKCPQEMLKDLSFALVGASKNVGLNLSKPVAVKSFDNSTSITDALSDAKSREIHFAFVILSRSDTHHTYEELKFIADVKLGLITQCMEDEVVLRCCRRGRSADQILNNLLSKLNTKLGGINHTFSKQPTVGMTKTIVMGADAAHSPRGSKCPSIAAVVGSIDEVPFQYAVSCKVQTNPDESKLSQEIILEMKEMTKHILNSYRNRNGYFPERIIFFRDGVSQGQFEIVLKTELNWIQEACHEVFEKYPHVTFIVVQKRHQTRFVLNYSKDKKEMCTNVPPGTTVDTDVIHPVYFDYFQCSHEGIKGTSKPAHYVVLHDDNNFTADEIQNFSHELCHVYGRCNRSISIPAPAMYAHLAAARAKNYIDWHLKKEEKNTGSSRRCSTYKPSLPQEVIDFVNNISEIEAPMFFI